jgi:hypothetical protein
MPILLYVPQDPTDVVMQGEQLRQGVFDPVDLETPSAMPGAAFVSGLQSIVQDEDAFAPMNSFICINRLAIRRQKSQELQRRANAGISTPCGAWIPLDFPPLLRRFEQATDKWQIIGQTRTGAGAPLGAVKVLALETGRLNIPGAPVVGEALSDGSGNFAVDVPMHVAYQLTGYQVGFPDVAGITRNDVVPTTPSTSIFLRDPTATDTPGGGGTCQLAGNGGGLVG